MKTKAAYLNFRRILLCRFILINHSKALLLIFFTVSIFVHGCKKDEHPTPAQYLRFKLDGVAIECDKNLIANSGYYNPGSYLSITGTYDNIDLELSLSEDENIVTGQYIFAADKYRRASLWIDGSQHYAGDEGLFNNLVGSGGIIIIEISNDYIKGTFHFNLESSITSSPSKIITDGEFYLKLHQ